MLGEDGRPEYVPVRGRAANKNVIGEVFFPDREEFGCLKNTICNVVPRMRYCGRKDTILSNS